MPVKAGPLGLQGCQGGVTRLATPAGSAGHEDAEARRGRRLATPLISRVSRTAIGTSARLTV